MYSNAPIIIDIGTSTIKAGFGGQEKPSFIFPICNGEVNYQK